MWQEPWALARVKSYPSQRSLLCFFNWGHPVLLNVIKCHNVIKCIQKVFTALHIMLFSQPYLKLVLIDSFPQNWTHNTPWWQPKKKKCFFCLFFSNLFKIKIKNWMHISILMYILNICSVLIDFSSNYSLKSFLDMMPQAWCTHFRTIWPIPLCSTSQFPSDCLD